jgi:hypothetical protein
MSVIVDIGAPAILWRAESLLFDAEPRMIFAIETASVIVGETRNSARSIGGIMSAGNNMSSLRV